MRRLAALAALALLAGACNDSSGGDFCDRIAALADLDDLGRSGVDVDAFRDARDSLEQLDPPSELVPDVDALVALYDLVIDRFGDLDLRDPTPEQLAELQIAQQDLEARIIAADASLVRVRDARIACTDAD